MLNLKSKRMIFVMTLSILFGLTPAQTASAADNCRKVKGNLSVVNNLDGTTSGKITNGGILNGSTLSVFTSNFTPTPDPATFSYTGNLTISTHKGDLKTNDTGIFDFANAAFSEISRINSATSTGVFEGATGILFISGKSADDGLTFQAEITGEICFARPVK